MRSNTLAILKEYFGKDFKIPLPEIEKTNYHKTPEEIVARLYIQGAMNALTNENIDHDSLLQDMKSQDIYKFHEPDDEYFFSSLYIVLTIKIICPPQKIIAKINGL